MQKITCFVLAAALATASASAQNETAAENAVDPNAANMILPVDNEVVAANDMAALPAPAPVTTEPAPAPAPAPERSSRGFPWGVIGLVGLIGLMGRKRRD
mgnify:CR=1 FL=1